MQWSVVPVLVLVLAACGDSPVMPDAILDDAMADAPDARDVGPVEIIVTSYLAHDAIGPLVDIPVVFYRPDGRVESVAKTDGGGRATAMIERGSLVLVVYGNNPLILTNVDGAIASPGDTLHFGPTEVRAPVGMVNVSWPARNTGGQTSYTLSTPCGSRESGGTTASAPLYSDCASSTFDVVVTSSRFPLEASAIMSRRAISPAAMVTVDLGDNGATWEPGVPTTIAMQSSPNAGGSMPVGNCVADQCLPSGFCFHRDTSAQVGGSCEVTLMPGSDTTVQLEAGYRRGGDSRFALTVRRTIMHADAGTFDGSGAWPWITSVAFSSTTRTATWTSDQPAPLDFSVLELAGERGHWRIYVPNGLPPSFTLPTLPVEVATWEIIQGEVVRASLRNVDVVGATAADLMKHSLHHSRAFSANTTFGATAVTTP